MVFSEDISNKAGLLLDRAGDFESLSSNVYKETGRTIGISEYTLNTIAIYLGFDNWETYLKAKNIDSEWGAVQILFILKNLI